jgi:hypothetical protein
MPTFSLVDATGATLGPLTLSISGSSSVQPIDFAGSFVAPSVPFQVAATGTTADGAANFTVQFTNVSGLLSNASNLNVSVAQGQSVSVPITVTFPATLKNVFSPKLVATASVTGDATRTGTTTLPVWLDGTL